MNKEDKIVWGCVIILITFFVSAALGVFNKSHAEDKIPTNASTFVYSGSCFWCAEVDAEKLDGVYDAISGFTGGTYPERPRYYYGKWGNHIEAVEVHYDPTKLTFRDLVVHVFNTVDYEDTTGGFCDKGHSYRAALYYENEEQLKIIKDLEPKTSNILILPRSNFYPVRAEHQDYAEKNPFSYYYYRKGCRRDFRINQLKQKNGEIK